MGLDFLAHPFWDKYIEYEERQEAQDRIYAIHARLIRIPLHQYARYYERFRTLAHTCPLADVAPAEDVARFRAEVEAEAAAAGAGPRQELEVERDIRAKIDAMYYEIFTVTQAEVSKRWTYESEIKRPYFHVTELEHSQLANWRKYLDFEEAEGDYARIVCLYERCLTTCALYDDFWFRYARWMAAQTQEFPAVRAGQPPRVEQRREEVRGIYMRASTLFVPVSRPGIRLQWALFEESCGRVDVAADIHAAVLQRLPDCTEVVTSWANLERRQHGLEAAVEVYRNQIEAPTVDLYTKAALVAEWAYMLWRVGGDADEARALFVKNTQWYADSRVFWERWFRLETDQPLSQPEHGARVKNVFDQLCTHSRLSPAVKKELSKAYLDYLVQDGGKDAMEVFLQVDREMFGYVTPLLYARVATTNIVTDSCSPASVSTTAKLDSTAKENGAGRGELDDATRFKAESRRLVFYELHGDPVEAQGPADFN